MHGHTQSAFFSINKTSPLVLFIIYLDDLDCFSYLLYLYPLFTFQGGRIIGLYTVGL